MLQYSLLDLMFLVTIVAIVFAGFAALARGHISDFFIAMRLLLAIEAMFAIVAIVKRQTRRTLFVLSILVCSMFGLWLRGPMYDYHTRVSRDVEILVVDSETTRPISNASIVISNNSEVGNAIFAWSNDIAPVVTEARTSAIGIARLHVSFSKSSRFSFFGKSDTVWVDKFYVLSVNAVGYVPATSILRNLVGDSFVWQKDGLLCPAFQVALEHEKTSLILQ